jgi:hypothetical protein
LHTALSPIIAALPVHSNQAIIIGCPWQRSQSAAFTLSCAQRELSLIKYKLIFKIVKTRALYRDWRLVVGVVLVILGVGNWSVGFIGTEQYRQSPNLVPQTAAEDVSSSFEGLDDSSNQAVLTPLTKRQRKVSFNSAQMDFFHAVFVVGEAIFVCGLVTTLLALLSAFRRDAKKR